MIVGTNIGTLARASGDYLIPRVPAGRQQVRVVLIGFSQQTQVVDVPAGGTAVADFALSISAIELEGVVVSSITGREQRQRELGANVASIELAEIETTPITSVSDILSGRTEGLILQDVNGTTGTAQRIRIRGANSVTLSNEPLVFVDGIQYESLNWLSLGVGGQEAGRLNDLNPNDIESIEVVKGPAATALYGTAAANGVLLITTKRGRSGDAEWNFYAEYGEIDDITDYPANYMAYQIIGDPSAPFYTETGSFNSTDYAYCPNRAAAAARDCTQDGATSFNSFADPRTSPHSTGNRKRYGASVRGGTERVTYYLSGEYQDETGVVWWNTQEKASVRANLNAAIRDDLDIALSTGYTRSLTGFNDNDNAIFSPILGSLLSEPYYVPRSLKPASGRGANPGEHRANFGFGFNMWDKSQYWVSDDVDRLTIEAKGQYRPLDWLSLNVNGGLDLVSGHTYETVQKGLLPINPWWANGHRNSNRWSDYTYTLNASAIATFQPFENVVSTTTLGTSYNRMLFEQTECGGSSLVPGTSSCGTTASMPTVDEDFWELITIGGYAQQEIAWRDRVFLAGAIRGDDNSAFGADFGFATYPSASLSWVIGEEDWFPEVGFLSALRLRTAWGTSGLRPEFGDAVTLFEATAVTRGGSDESGVTILSSGNLRLEPERSTEYEAGLDADLFSGRVGVEFTYFHKKSRDAFIRRPLPPSWGVAEDRWENLGSIKNSGTELAVNVNAIDMRQAGLNLRATLTTLENEILELGEGIEPIIINRGLQRHAPPDEDTGEKYSAGSFWQKEVFWDDADGNGKLTNDEVTIADEESYIGPALPTWQTSFSADLRISDFMVISTLVEGRGGNWQGNDSEAFRCGLRSTRGCPAVGDPNASLFEQARYIADRYIGSAYGFVEKADFFKWRELSITFTPPESVVENAPQLDGLSLTLAGRNLKTWTDYSGLDPETVEGGGNANFSQSEFNTQPPVRYLMVRLSYTLR